MNARVELFAAYEEWRHWTELEGQAIESSNWPRMRECQDAKHQLQSRIIRDSDRARRECEFLGLNRGDMERDVRKVIEGLITLETRNGQVLANQRLHAEAEQACLDRTRSNLRRVHQSYGGKREAAWSSFS